MIEIFSLEFMRNAFMAGIMLSPVLAVVSFFVVLRRLSFVGVGVAHSAFGGIALGFLLGISPTITAIVFAIAVSNAIGYIGRYGKLSADTAIGIFFAFAMALGVVFIGMSDQYNVDLFGYLFGNILAITSNDLIIIALLGGFVLISIFLLFKELLFVSFDRKVALVSGMPVVFLDHFFLTTSNSLKKVVYCLINNHNILCLTLYGSINEANHMRDSYRNTKKSYLNTIYFD